MSSSNDKKKFEWEQGGTLDEKNTKPLGGVRARGIPKLKKAVAADPSIRKEERESFILKEQSQSYQEIAKKEQELDGTVVIEESTSGLSGDIEDSVAKKLIDPGKKLKGLGKFKDPEKFGKKK